MRWLPMLLLTPLVLGSACNPPGPAGDDDAGVDDDDATQPGDDDEVGDDDDEPADCTGDDPFYSESGGLPTGANPCHEPVLVKLRNVWDGDTFWAELPDGSEEKVRLIGVDTPELGDCYAGTASNYLHAQLVADCFWLTFDADCDDSYGRVLAYAHTRDGFVQVSLLEGGYAWAMEVAPNSTYASLFAAEQADAEAAGAGLWSACD